MKKILAILMVLTVSTLFVFANRPLALERPDPPPLMEPSIVPAPPKPHPGPAVPPGTPPVPPPSAPDAGIIHRPVPERIPIRNLAAAAATARKCLDLLVPGRVWIKQGPAGEVEVKGGLLYCGKVVAVLRFSPLDGSLLPMGVHPRDPREGIQAREIEARLDSLIKGLKVLPAAEFIEPEKSWSFPLAYGNAIVAHLRVYHDGIRIVPDQPENQEMLYYAR